MCLSILAFCCPPLAVCFKRGCGLDFCAAFFLTILGWLPGCIYACCIVHREEEKGHTTNFIMTPATATPAQHIVVNVNERGGGDGFQHHPQHPYPQTHQPQPLPQHNFPTAPMPMPMPMHEPPPMYPPPYDKQ